MNIITIGFIMYAVGSCVFFYFTMKRFKSIEDTLYENINEMVDHEIMIKALENKKKK